MFKWIRLGIANSAYCCHWYALLGGVVSNARLNLASHFFWWSQTDKMISSQVQDAAAKRARILEALAAVPEAQPDSQDSFACNAEPRYISHGTRTVIIACVFFLIWSLFFIVLRPLTLTRFRKWLPLSRLKLEGSWEISSQRGRFRSERSMAANLRLKISSKIRKCTASMYNTVHWKRRLCRRPLTRPPLISLTPPISPLPLTPSPSPPPPRPPPRPLLLLGPDRPPLSTEIRRHIHNQRPMLQSRHLGRNQIHQLVGHYTTWMRKVVCSGRRY